MNRETLWPIRLLRLHVGANALYHCLPISLILFAATVLFTYRLEGEGLWLDELTSIQDASLTPLEAYRVNQLGSTNLIMDYRISSWIAPYSGNASIHSTDKFRAQSYLPLFVVLVCILNIKLCIRFDDERVVRHRLSNRFLTDCQVDPVSGS